MTNEHRGSGTEQGQDGSAIGVRRRGLFAAAWAAVAGLVAVRTTERVQAVSGGGPDGNLVMGSNFLNGNNVAANQTNLVPSSLDFVGDVMFDCDAAFAGGTTTNLNAIYGNGRGNGAGIVGATGGDPGEAAAAFPSAGVLGLSLRTFDGGIGVRGEIPGNSTVNGIAVYGANNSSYAGPGPGAGGFGVYGLSAKGHGLVGATAAPGAAAIVGATNGVGGAYAATFYGPVAVTGNFTVFGGAKSAAVPHPDGSHRRLYCVESPESWFEDFGEGRLACGRAEVSIDPDFGAVVDLTKYHVFLSAYDTDHHLHVSNRTAKGFTVEADLALAASKGAKESELDASFSWRIVARRKDIAGDRLETVEVPKEPRLPGIPAISPRSRSGASRR